MRRNYHRKNYRISYISNHLIRGDSFRLIDEQGKQIGTFSRQEAFNIAAEKQVDLVLITGKTVPPIVKTINIHKYIYQQEKKAKESKKGIKKSTTKDIVLSLFIGEHDLKRLINKAKDFLVNGHQVRIKLTLKGRELGKKPMAFDLLNKFIKSCGDISISTPPRLLGRMVIAVITKQTHKHLVQTSEV